MVGIPVADLNALFKEAGVETRLRDALVAYRRTANNRMYAQANRARRRQDSGEPLSNEDKLALLQMQVRELKAQIARSKK